MEICKAPTLQLKVLNKHSINTPNVQRDGNIISSIFFYKNKPTKFVFQISNNCIRQCPLLAPSVHGHQMV